MERIFTPDEIEKRAFIVFAIDIATQELKDVFMTDDVPDDTDTIEHVAKRNAYYVSTYFSGCFRNGRKPVKVTFDDYTHHVKRLDTE